MLKARLLIAGLAIAALIAGVILGYKLWQQHNEKAIAATPYVPPPQISYDEYVELGRAKMNDPVYRMGPMIDLQCEVTTDYVITPAEHIRIKRLYDRLKNKPEKVHEHLMTICAEWRERKKFAA